MPDIFDAAVAEARASASVDVFELETVEIIHPALVGDDDLPDSLRLVLDERAWMLLLEADAPLRGGQTVEFTPCAMRVVRPSQTEGQIGNVSLAFDFVSRAVLPVIDEALSIRADGRLVLRTWLATRNMATGDYSVAGPPSERLQGLTIREIRATETTVELTAAFKDMVNVGFPRRLFTQADFPGLF